MGTAATTTTNHYVGIATDEYRHPGASYRRRIDGQRVTWIAWDSPGREVLRIGDIICAAHVDKISATEAERLPRFSYPYVNDHEIWTALGTDGGKQLSLSVLRDGLELELTLIPTATPNYRNAANQRALFPGGPYYLANNGFRESWSAWYERIVKEWSRILADGWRMRQFDSRRLLKAHADERQRIEYLLEHFPGEFTTAIASDWEKVHARLQGRLWPVHEIALDFREYDKQRIDTFHQAAKKAHTDFKDRVSSSLRKPFPAPDPYDDKAAEIIGSLVCIDGVTPRDMRGDRIEAWYIMGDRFGGWYFLDANSTEVRRLGDCIFAYHSLVRPQLAERYTFYLEVLDQPMMRPRERGNVVRGFCARLVAAMVGNQLFVDALDTPEPLMAGQDSLRNQTVQLPPDTASPEDIVIARVDAVKWARRDVWTRLRADWTVSADWTGNPVYLPYSVGDADSHSHWEQSRKRLLSDVIDVRVIDSTKPYVVLEADETRNIPRIEEVEVDVEHVGVFHDEYRSFKDTWLTRSWRLQRVGNGPWRHVYPGAL